MCAAASCSERECLARTSQGGAVSSLSLALGDCGLAWRIFEGLTECVTLHAFARYQCCMPRSAPCGARQPFAEAFGVPGPPQLFTFYL